MNRSIQRICYLIVIDKQGAVTRGTFTAVKLHLVRVTDISQGKLPMLNFHGYVKKISESAHDI